MVAPRAGAWIETDYLILGSRWAGSLPARERGLKRETAVDLLEEPQSLPARERGLKHAGEVAA